MSEDPAASDRASARGAQELAVEAIRAGDCERAARLLREALELAPDAPDLLCNYGAALQALGRPDEAADSYRRAVAVGGEPAALLQYNLGTALAQAGDYAGAEVAYRAALAHDSDHVEAHGNLGVLLYQLGKLDEAAAVLAHATTLSPEGVQLRCNLGATLCALGDGRAAEAAYREACALAPESVQAHTGLAAALILQDQHDAAIVALERALAIEPTAAEPRQQLAAVFGRQRSLEKAEEIYRSLIERMPEDAWSHNGLGAVLEAQERRDEAQAAFARALALSPEWADAHYNLGVSLERSGQLERAVASYSDALERAPEHVLAMNNLAGVHRALGNIEDAGRLYEHAARLAPHDEVATHLAAAMAGQTTVRAPAGYVRKVFDDYADRYDGHMRETLDYRAPEALGAAIAAAFGEGRVGVGPDEGRVGVGPSARRAGVAIDLGCGTGLLGRAVSGYVEHLVGVDLSPRMIELARASGVYGELIEGDIIDYLSGREAASCELVMAADVLIYLGDLSALFAAVGRALRVGGVWAFSVEEHAGDEAYILRDTARYAHARPYLERLAEDAGLVCRAWQEVTLRLERGDPVPGLLGVMERPAADG
ncbi:MAG: tetratricopeptide repeat protein [Haliangiales bacterium]